METADSQSVVVRKDGNRTTITLNRPDRLNAVSEDMYEGVLAGLKGSDADPDCRVVVLEGAGRAFCVGADLKAHAEGSRNAHARRGYVWLAQEVVAQMRAMGKPVVASVHGHAYGAGAEIALNSDFIIMANDARMAFPEIAIGTYVGGGITYLLPRLVGLSRARELLLTGRAFTARDAYDWGMIHSAVALDQRAHAVDDLACALAAAAPVPLRAMRLELAGQDDGFDAALSREARDLLACMETADWHEGAVAFREKRPPSFVGR